MSWTLNRGKNGLVVNGHHVTIYGLFNEHFQEYGTIWNGEKGRMYFYQNETPYDVTNQQDYMSHNGTVEGYAQYKVADHVNYHEAYMMGLYDVFINTQNAKIGIENSVEVPESKGVKLHHVCNVRISSNNMGGFKNIVNNQVQSTYYTNEIARRFYIVDYSGNQEPAPWKRPEDSTQDFALKNDHYPVVSYDKQNEKLYLNTNNSTDYSVVLYDLAGKMVLNDLYRAPISLSFLPWGIYAVLIAEGDESLHRTKIMKSF